MEGFRLSVVSSSKWEMFIYICIVNIKYGKNLQQQFHRSELIQFKYQALSHSLMPLFGLTKVERYENVIQANLNKMYKEGNFNRITGEGKYDLTKKGIEKAVPTHSEFVKLFEDPQSLILQIDDKIISGKNIGVIELFKDIDAAYAYLKKLGILTPTQSDNGLKKIKDRKELLVKYSGLEKDAAKQNKSDIYEEHKELFDLLGLSKEEFINRK